ncbi:MAG TPA: hypothetical protein PK593_00505 [Thermomicrobiales bacterium]|jgi:hypothetical protein|nr:hypothetical protein [Chloroflexota bacterium]HQX61915.1 hypothetical protein [Thermomicrobiales bacterium]HQZ89346.1 hypothetical protein [Thermomicrobiales bacterium]HRA30796.1 hypothetical protein [Thermomicrobiales bacterium]
MTSSIPAALSDIVEQARDVRERCLDCALAAIPERDDAEGWLLFVTRQLIRPHLLNVPPGICDLACPGERELQRLTC